ncbi:hypothetical protein PMIN04_012338 [Paraphaeosphaeria minitans]
MLGLCFAKPVISGRKKVTGYSTTGEKEGVLGTIKKQNQPTIEASDAGDGQHLSLPGA